MWVFDRVSASKTSIKGDKILILYETHNVSFIHPDQWTPKTTAPRLETHIQHFIWVKLDRLLIREMNQSRTGASAADDAPLIRNVRINSINFGFAWHDEPEC